MSKVKKLAVALLVLVIGLFAGFTLVGCGDDAPTVTDLSEKATLTVADITYGETPTGVVTYGEKTLVEGKDYDIEFGDYSQVANEVIATVTFKGKYKGSVTDTYAVKAYDVSAAVVSLANADEKIVYTQNPAGAIPSGIVVTYGGQTVDSANYDVAYSNQYAVGTATATVTFKGNYAGTATLDYTIEPFKVTADNAEFTIEDITVGETPNPVLVVYGYVGLMPRVDFDVEFGDYENVSDSVTATVTFKGNYSGTITATYSVNAIDASEAVVSLANADEKIVYTQNPAGAIPSGIVVTYGGQTVDSANYDVAYSNQYAVGTATATVTFKGNYAGSATLDYTIEPFKVTADNAEFTIEDITVGETPNPVLVVDGYVGLMPRVDFDVEFGDYENVSDSVTATITFKGNYSGTLTATYKVGAINASQATFTVADIEVGKTPTAVVELSGYTLVEGTDYEINYGNYSAIADEVTATITFKGNYSGTLTATYKVKAIAVTPTVTLDASEFRYDGSAKTPTVTVQANGITFTEADYEVAYDNNVNAGVATVTVTMKGNYSGTATATFNIIEYAAVELTASVEKQEIVGASRELFDMPEGAINDAEIKVVSGGKEYEVKVVNGKPTVEVPVNGSYDITAEWNGYKASASAQITSAQSLNLEFKSGFKLGGTVRGKGADGKDYEYVSYAKNSYTVSGDTITFNAIGWAYLNTEATDKYYLETQLKLTNLGSMIGFLAASEFGNLSNDADKVLQGPSDKLRQKFVLALSGGSGKILFRQHTTGWNTSGLVNMGVTALGHASDAKFAILRDGNDYYVFINDKYAGSYTTDRYGKSGFGFASTDNNKQCIFANVKTTTSSTAVDAIKAQLLVPTLGGFYSRENDTTVGGIGNITVNADGKSGTLTKESSSLGSMAMLSGVTGSVYYAEATFPKSNAWKGLVVNTMDSHQPKDNLGWLSFGMLGATMYMHEYGTWNTGTNVAKNLINATSNDVKIGVARINDWYYVYVNDALVLTKHVPVWSARLNNSAVQKMAVLPADNESGIGVYCGTNETGTANFSNFNYTLDANEVARKVGGAVINYDSEKYAVTQCGKEVKTGSYLLPEQTVTVTSLDGTAVKVLKDETAIATSASENAVAFVAEKGATYSVGLYSDENVTLSIAVSAKELMDTVGGKEYNIFKDYLIDPQYLQVKISDGTTVSVYDAISSNPIINGLEAKEYTIKVVYAGIEQSVTKTLSAGNNEMAVTIDPIYLGGHVVINGMLYQPYQNVGVTATRGGSWSLVDGKRDTVSMTGATFVMQHGVVGTNYYVEGTFDSTNDLGVRVSTAGLMVAHGTSNHLNDVPSDYRLIATIYGDHIVLCNAAPSTGAPWVSTNAITIADIKAMGITVADATKVRLGVIRENTTYHFFVDGQYATTYCVPEIKNASGIGTARCGGGNAFTVSNFRYSTSSEYIGALKETMPKEKEIDLYFIAGQSNGSGYSKVNTSSSLYSAENANTGYGNILYAGDAESTSNGATVHSAFNWQVARIGMGKSTSHIGAEAGFAQVLASQYTTNAKTAGIIKMAHGGTNLQDNVTGTENKAGGNWAPPTYLEQNGVKDARYSGGMYEKLIAEAEKRIAELKAMGYTKFNFKGLFWMQGESDRSVPDTYKGIMKTFISDVRADLGEVATKAIGTEVDLSKMPIYIGEISETFGANETTKDAYDAKCNVNKAFIAMQNQLAKEVNDVYVVPSGSYVICEWNGSGVTIKGTDQSHWSFDSMIEIGKAWGNMAIK